MVQCIYDTVNDFTAGDRSLRILNAWPGHGRFRRATPARGIRPPLPRLAPRGTGSGQRGAKELLRLLRVRLHRAGVDQAEGAVIP